MTPTRWALAAALLAAALYVNAIPGPFLFDDIVEIKDNPRVQSLGNIPSLLTTDFWGLKGEHGPLYRPMTAALTTLLYVGGGGRPWVFHAANLLFHAVASGLCVFVTWRLTRSAAVAGVTALIFAAHPIHTEAVAWISGEAEIVAAVCVLAAWLAHLHGRVVVAAVAFALGMLSKEVAIVFPALAAAGDLFGEGAPGTPRARTWRERLRPTPAAAAAYAIYGGAAVGYLVLRLAVLGHVFGGAVSGSELLNPLWGAPAVTRVLTSLGVYGRAIGQSIFPKTLCLDYGFDQIPLARSPIDGAVAAGLAAIGVLIGVAIAGERRRARAPAPPPAPGRQLPPAPPLTPGRPLSLGAAVFLIAFLPTSNLLFPGVSIFAERNLYLPVLGIALMAAALVMRLRPAALAAAIAAVLVVGAGARTIVRNAEFLDPMALYRAAVAACPRSARAHSFLGIALREQGDTQGAMAAQNDALGIAPHYSDAHAEKGLVLMMEGDSAAAERELNEALRLDPEDREARANLASVYADSGRISDALREVGLLRQMYPDDPEVLNNYAGTLMARGDAAAVQEAAAIFGRIKEAWPRSPLGPNGLGAVRAGEGKPDLAAAEFEEALRRDPGNANATFNLARLYAQRGQTPRAIELLERAIAAGQADDEMVRLRNTLRGVSSSP